MASLKTKGDLAELKVAADLIERGYRVAIPFGEDNDFDLIPLPWQQVGTRAGQIHAVEWRGHRRQVLFGFVDQRTRSANQAIYRGNHRLACCLRRDY
jgi:hypothetical protein